MAAEKAANLLLGPVVNATISKVTEQLNLAMGFKQELKRFHDTLDMVRGVLRDAEQQGVTGRPDLKRWLEGLWSIAEEADDVMDEIAFENLRQKVVAQEQMLNKVSYFFTPSNPLAFRLKMAKKIKNLNVALDDLNTRATRLGLQHKLENRSPEPRGIQQTDSFLGEPSGVIGRDGDVEQIIKLLIDSSNQQPLYVVSIVGLAGLGKTTLAKLVCNNDQIQGHFSKIMWICVSENFDVRRILVQMLESLTKGGCENITSRDVVLQNLKEKLEEKNYLLILDDVWNEDREKWEDLRHCLLGISKQIGSRVLVTTRIQNVALVMGTLPGHVHCLKQLQDDDCWSIIRHRVFGNSLLEELETIGRENAKRCKGVPLVARVLGGILCNISNKDVWREVWGSVEEANGVFPVLQLSFNRLPKSALKQCFAFCSIFPKDFVIEKEILIQLWMAHGFLQPSSERHMEMEDIGDKYFNDLLSYSLFQDAETDSYGNVITCKMHDLIHDLAQTVSKSQTLILGNGSRSNITADTRHLNLMSNEATAEMGDAMQKLHTLFSKPDVFHNMPVNIKKVRVLSFCGAKIDKLPALLRKLKHLRYLDVSETGITELPKFITKLYQLQTLRFRNCLLMERPLEGIANLINLRHIYFNDEKHMPAGVGTLTCLQTLQLFVVDKQMGRQIEELGGLSQLRGKLEITNLKMVRNREEALRAKLLERTAIQKLALDFGQKRSENWAWLGRYWKISTERRSEECRSEERRKHDEDVLEGLQPHSNLKSLKISNYCGEKCPSWMLEDPGNLGESTYLKNLVSLGLFDFPQLKSIPSLSLSNLVELTISGFEELEIMPSLSLSNVVQVQIINCKKLKSIVDSSLQELIISGCSELVSIEFGPLAMMSLKKIMIEWCNKLESLSMFNGIGESVSTSKCLREFSITFNDSSKSVSSLHGFSSVQKIYIGSCRQLKSIGESLFTSMCLKKLNISGCDSLELLPSLVGFSSLQKIHISSCKKLKSIGGSLSASTCLKRFSISDCQSLELIPSMVGLSSLQNIHISTCGKLKSIGESLSTCKCLKELYINSCGSLELVPSLDGLSSLQSINISFCGKLKSIGERLSSSMCLKELNIGQCDSLEKIPSLDRLSSLHCLHICGCPGLMSLPSLDGLSSLRTLEIGYCPGLLSLPSLYGLSSLRSLTIQNCDKLTSLPSGLSSLTALEVLRIQNCHNLISVEEDSRGLCSLLKLIITRCEKLKNILGVGEILGFPLTRLKVLHFGGFSAEQEELEEFPIQLEELGLVGWEKLKQLPHQIQRLNALWRLTIDDFDGLEALPEWLGNLSSLQSLEIRNCKSLKYMEAIRCLSNLKDLYIWGCPELTKRCTRESGSEWNNISHIPSRSILDGQEQTTELGLTFEDAQESQLATWKRPFFCCKG